jgi:hypothetical protein
VLVFLLAILQGAAIRPEPERAITHMTSSAADGDMYRSGDSIDLGSGALTG